jgi:hypothetical protein
MSPTPSSQWARIGLLVLAVGGAGLLRGEAAAQEAPSAPGVVSSTIQVSRDAAVLELELTGDRSLKLALRNQRVEVNGEEVGTYQRGDALDRSWRDLLERAMDREADALAELLLAWEPPGGEAGSRLDAALEAALREGAAPPAEVQAPPRADRDSISKLENRIAELERLVRDLERNRAQRAASDRGIRPGLVIGGLFGQLWDGLRNILAVLVNYAVLAGLGFAIVYFGRRYLEGVADTARHAPVRSGLVGLAAFFLAIPAFILGIFVLIVSIVGIPALLAWIPLFPVALVAVAFFGYMAVAHAVGEALAERRLHGPDWLHRGNSYYYILTGLGLLLAPFIASAVVRVAGGLMEPIRIMLGGLAFVLTGIALAIGLGAFLLSRAGTRPLTRSRPLEPDLGPTFEEEAHV